MQETELEKQSSDILRESTELKIASIADYERACGLLKVIKMLRDQIAEAFDPIIRKAHEAHKQAINSKKKYDDPVNKAESFLKSSMSKYLYDEERKRKELEEKLRIEERKKEEEKILAKAEELEKQGKKAEAEIELKKEIVAPIIEIQKPTVEGISTRKILRWKVVDESKINRKFLMPDEVKINAIVKSMGKESASIIGGIELFEEIIAYSRS